MKLVWSLANKDPKTPHNPYVYDMFYLSIHMAKDLGYETVLYGTSDAIERLGDCVDEIHNTDSIEYVLFDDLKIHIWDNRTDDYATIDGDVFLYSPIEFNTNSFLSFDEMVNKIEVDYVVDALNLLNSFDIDKRILEWNPNSTNSISTNLIRWKSNNVLLKYFIQSYRGLRTAFLENEVEIVEINSELAKTKSLISHLLCEHLLERIVSYYKLPLDELRRNKNNSYSHWQGSEKFENIHKINGVKLIVETHKNFGGTIKSVYNSLLSQGLIEPILYN